MKRIVLFVLVISWALGALVIPVGAVPPEQGTSQSAGSGPRTITGTYETTNPIYPLVGGEVGIMLYDMWGEIQDDYAFHPDESVQVIGELDGDIVSGSYRIDLPAAPQGVLLDFDGDDSTPPAVQVFAAATFIEFLGDEYLNRGEEVQNLSARLAPFTWEVVGGTLIVWSANEGEWFPSGLGLDGVLFTGDEPLMLLPAGWSVVSLETDSFTISREETVDVTVIESLGALNDYTEMTYEAAWSELFWRTRETYPFTAEKNLDWDAIYAEITPLVKVAGSDLDFHLAMAHFGALIPDTHVGYVSLPVMQSFLVGGVGISELDITDDEQIVVTGIVPGLPADGAGMQVGDVLVEVDGVPALQTLDETPLLLTSASTPHGRRALQMATMLQGVVGSAVTLTWLRPDGTLGTATLTREFDASSILAAFDTSGAFDLVIESRLLDSGVGYIKVTSFAENISQADAMFRQALKSLVNQGASGIILDVRGNTGGLINLAMAMAGRFFGDYIELADLYYADGEGNFTYRGFIEILVSDMVYDGPVAVLVNEMTGSAGELFVYAMQVDNRAIIVGSTPTGGFSGEVSDGQYTLPGELTVQIPTGRPVDPVTGSVLIEGVGVVPDIDVPVTVESLLSPEDEVLIAAEEALLTP